MFFVYFCVFKLEEYIYSSSLGIIDYLASSVPMLSYQHGYHAGNFADVIKHFTLSRTLSYMTTKDKPLLYLETHSGRGIYDFKDGQALKTKEFHDGIAKLWEKRAKAPEVFHPYLNLLQ